MHADAQHTPPPQPARRPVRPIGRCMLGAGVCITPVGAARGASAAHALLPTRVAPPASTLSATANAQTIPSLQSALDDVAEDVGPGVVSVQTDQGLGSGVPDPPPLSGFPGHPRTRLPQAPVGVDHGAPLAEVASDGPLAQAGIQIGDMIVSFDGVDIYNPDERLQRLVLHKRGDQVPVTDVANRNTVTYTVTVGEAPVH